VFYKVIGLRYRCLEEADQKPRLVKSSQSSILADGEWDRTTMNSPATDKALIRSPNLERWSNRTGGQLGAPATDRAAEKIVAAVERLQAPRSINRLLCLIGV